MELNRKWLLAMCSLILFCLSCSTDDNSPDRSNSNVNLDMDINNGTWVTSNVTMEDMGARSLHFRASSTAGGLLDMEGILYQGIGTYSAANLALGNWYMTPDAQTNLPYYTGTGLGPLSGSITFLDHDTLNDLLSGAFDIYMINVSDNTDTVHLIGDFFDLDVSPGQNVQSNVTANLNGVSFVNDYTMVYQIENEVYMECVNNITDIITVRWNRNTLGTNNYDVTQMAPIRVHYRNGGQIFTQQASGNINVSAHSSVSPATTTADFDVQISDFGSPNQHVTGSFTVNYN